ncbi:MAG: hypothetical protein BWY83_03408 [bacterium ADurb.Bin478]|nr:MAG: hypothetical protein BWY83_03408 [bacterium ADurb.Bin478]
MTSAHIAIGLQSLLNAGHIDRAGDMGDTTETPFDQMLHQLTGALIKIDHHLAGLQTAAHPVEKNQWNAGIHNAAKGRVVDRELRSGGQHAGHPVADQRRYVFILLIHTLVGLTDHHRIAMPVRLIGHFTDDGGKKVVRQLGDDHADHVAFLVAEIGRKAVGNIVHLLRCG